METTVWPASQSVISPNCCLVQMVDDQDLAAESRGISDIEPGAGQFPQRGWTRIVQRDHVTPER